MKRLQRTIGTMALLLLGIGVAAAQAEPQFNGSWVMVRSQSQFPSHEGGVEKAPDAQQQPPAPSHVTLLVAQQGHTLQVNRTVAMGTRLGSMSDPIVAGG